MPLHKCLKYSCSPCFPLLVLKCPPASHHILSTLAPFVSGRGITYSATSCEAESDTRHYQGHHLFCHILWSWEWHQALPPEFQMHLKTEHFYFITTFIKLQNKKNRLSKKSFTSWLTKEEEEEGVLVFIIYMHQKVNSAKMDLSKICWFLPWLIFNPEDGSGMFIWNIRLSPDYMALEDYTLQMGTCS
jgi:hypothetical protein